MKNKCIFCGSKKGNNQAFIKSAQALAKHIANNGMALVYGGSSIGLKGVLADTLLKEKGRVYGVSPSI